MFICMKKKKDKLRSLINGLNIGRVLNMEKTLSGTIQKALSGFDSSLTEAEIMRYFRNCSPTAKEDAFKYALIDPMFLVQCIKEYNKTHGKMED